MRTKLEKMTALLLAVAMLMILNFPSGIFGNIGFGMTANAEGTITPTAPTTDDKGVYQIGTAAELYWFAQYVNIGNDSVNAVLVNDITVNENVLKADGTLADDVSGFTDWTPIGWYDYDNWEEHYYTGTFDGAGHTISGLYFNDTNSSDVGLFGDVGKNGSVSNVGIVDSYFQGYEDVGGVCGDNGGIITNCYSTGAVNGDNLVGGVCGENKGTITNCYNTAAVSGNIGVGGVCGYSEGTITSCYSTGKVSSEGESVGGVCGYNSGGTIANCYYLKTDTINNGISAIGNEDSETVGKAESKTTDQFAGGEVAYLLQSTQTADTKSGTIPQVWGQTLNADDFPVLTSDITKKVCKVTFATKDNAEYAVKYANPSGIYELPTNPTAADGYVFYKWSTSDTDYSNAANDFTTSTAVTADITVYAVSSEKYGETDDTKTVTTTYGTEKTQDLSAYTVYASYIPADGETAASGTTSVEKFTYTIENGNDVLGATINGDTLTIPSTAAAGTYTLTIKATEKAPEVSLMSDDLGTEPFTFDVAVTVNTLAENTPSITVNYTDETLIGFESGKYTIDGTDVTPTNGSLAVESYMGQTISIVKKASDTNHADSTAQSLEIPKRPDAPTGISATKASDNDASNGTINNVNDTMEYKAADADEWQSVTDTQITGLAAGSYEVRYKATSMEFASASAAVTISVVEKFTITFVNYNDEVLQAINVAFGSTPQYSGETPTRPDDDKYTYTFVGWSPEITEVTGIATYAAQFERTPIDYYVELTDEVKATVLAPEGGNCLLIFAAYDANGVMTGIELQNITFDEAGEQEFAPQTLNTSDAVKIKVMLWSDISEISPKCNSDEMSLQ